MELYSHTDSKTSTAERRVFYVHLHVHDTHVLTWAVEASSGEQAIDVVRPFVSSGQSVPGQCRLTAGVDKPASFDAWRDPIGSAERINIDADGAWTCLCGHEDSFEACDVNGGDLEENTNIEECYHLFRCERCNRVIDERDGYVVGYRSPSAA